MSKMNKKSQQHAEIKRILQKLYNVFGDTKRGAIVNWEDIEVIAEGYRYDYIQNQALLRFRKDLLYKRGVATRAVRGVGLYFMTNRDQVDQCSKDRLSRIRGQAIRGFNELNKACSGRLDSETNAKKGQALTLFNGILDTVYANETLFDLTSVDRPVAPEE